MSIRQLFFLTVWDEEEIEGILERFPEFGERVRDWQVIGTIGEQLIVHVIVQDLNLASRLYQRFGYLGKSYRAIARDAKEGDAICRQVIKKIAFTNWEIDNPDPEGPEKINHRGSLGEWIEEGRPTRLSGWQKAHDWFGHALGEPSDDDVGE